MQLKLNVWSSGTFTRVYLNGLPIAGKAWLQPNRGRTYVHFEKGEEGLSPDEVLSLVEEATGCDPLD